MVTADQAHPDAGPLQTPHARGKVETGVVVLPVAIVEIAGNEEQLDFFLQGELDEIVEGPSGGPAQFFDGATLMAFQASQGTVEVDIGGVEKFHRGEVCRHDPIS